MVSAAIAATSVIAIVGTGLGWPGWMTASATAAVAGVALIVGLAAVAVPLGGRAACWAAAEKRWVDRPTVDGPRTEGANVHGPTAAQMAVELGVPGVVGLPKRLHPSRSRAPVHRRFNAQVVPVRAERGPLADGAALLVHGRRDRVELQDGDRVLVRALPLHGRYLLQRPADGALFAAQNGWFSAW